MSDRDLTEINEFRLDHSFELLFIVIKCIFIDSNRQIDSKSSASPVDLQANTPQNLDHASEIIAMIPFKENDIQNDLWITC